MNRRPIRGWTKPLHERGMKAGSMPERLLIGPGSPHSIDPVYPELSPPPEPCPAPRWERLRTRSSPYGLNNSRPSPAGARPGSTPAWNQGDPPCSFPPWPRMAAGSDRFGLLELRVSRTFLCQLRPQLLRLWIPNSKCCQDLRPRSDRFWLLELRVSSDWNETALRWESRRPRSSPVDL